MQRKSLITILAVLLLITIIVASIVAGTYARYASKIAATATANTAAWTFEGGFADGENTSVTSINLYNTIQAPGTTYPNLAINTIAPGTSGTIPIKIDATGSEVGINYTVNFKFASGDFLAGLIFKDGETTLTYTEEQGCTFTGFIAKDTVNKVITKDITWEWALNDADIEGTGVDNNFADKDYTINVTITGTQHIGTTP